MYHTRAPRLTPASMIMAVLVHEDPSPESALTTYMVRELPALIRRVEEAGIRAVKLFAADTRDQFATRATANDSVMIRAIKTVKDTSPQMRVLTETCLCSYLPSGLCHFTAQDGRPDIPATLDALTAQAICQAEAGADAVGPAGMTPGGVNSVRDALGEKYYQVQVIPHLIFSSGLYARYRAAMTTTPPTEERAFHLPPGTDLEAAVRVGARMIFSGADALLIEPALFSADLLAGLAPRVGVPLLPFSVSGECATLPPALLAEEYAALLRAGATQVISHVALEVAHTLKDLDSYGRRASL